MEYHTHHSEKMFVNEVEFQRLLEIYTGTSQGLLKKVNQIVAPKADAIAATFYYEMLSLSETAPFLDNTLVDNRLRKSLAHWLRVLFLPSNERDVKKHIEHQKEIGNVHARINVPISLVNHGFRIIKRQCWQTLINSSLEREEIAEALVIVDELLDYCADLINDSYVNDMVVNEHNAQSLRMNAINQNLAIECERLRALLFDWLRKLLSRLYQNQLSELQPLPSIHTSDFGLWVIYKAELFFVEHQELVDKLKQHLNRIDDSVKKIISHEPETHQEKIVELGTAVAELNDHVTHAAWLLSSLVEHALEMEGGRDPLTRLFNRRYIPTIMQRAIRINLKNGSSFGILMVDIDHFKQINDNFGHEQGDTVLSQFGELLATHVRAGDFVFRYGGEEFLILLSHANLETAKFIAERLCALISQHHFTLKHSRKRLRITASIGVALYEGHPDYSQVINRADQALYDAKMSGRNQVIIAAP